MGSRKGRDYIFWVDLECSGKDDDEDIIEIGAVITNRDLEELDSKSIVLGIDPHKFANMSEVVVNMHTQNGLLDEVLQRGFYNSDMDRSMQLAQIDDELSEWVKSFSGGSHMPIGGSGVAHYDRKYIRRDLPKLDKRITYFHLDIGSVRRIVDIAGLEWPEFHMTKSHRALDDVRQHVEETRRFLDWCNKARWKIGPSI